MQVAHAGAFTTHILGTILGWFVMSADTGSFFFIDKTNPSAYLRLNTEEADGQC